MIGHVQDISVLKIGGSVLPALDSYRTVATHLAEESRRWPTRRVLAVVSAQDGHTDALEGEASVAAPSRPDRAFLDLLLSTGELRSVALLTLALQSAGVRATGLNVQETGIRSMPQASVPEFDLLVLRAALCRYGAVVVPGFLASRFQKVVTLGRGGSDLTAVWLAHALGAAECVLLKDVDGYFTADPARHPGATRIPSLTYDAALRKADAGCPLVQRHALAEARRTRVPLVVRSLSGSGTTVSD